MKVHLVDGTFELFRAHFGAPDAKSPDGRSVGATRGLLRSLHALVRRPDVTHVACAFDTVVESFRNKLFAGYKTGEGVEPELLAQFPLAERAAAALGIPVWSMTEFEADDALATGAARYVEDQNVEEVILCTPDKDLAQCVTERVSCWDRMRDRTLDPAGVVGKFGVTPASIPDYLALVGDAADGIPGVPRWGAKSSALALHHYGRLDAIPQDPAAWEVKIRGARGLSQLLNEHMEEALLYRQLATLRIDVPIAESLDDLRWSGPNRALLKALCTELGDERFLRTAATVQP